MKNLKLVITLALFLFAAVFSYATEGKYDLAAEYLKITKTKETIDLTIETYVQQLYAQYPDADKEKIRSMFNAYMGWAVLKEPTTKIIENSFTTKELEEIIDFYKTDSGKALANKSPGISAEISKLISVNLQAAIQQINI